jgi:CBS domain-containing protein
MVPDPVTVPPDLSVGELVDAVVWRRRYTTYPVVEDGRVVGLLPFRCVAEVPRSEWDSRRVRDCMIPHERVPVLDPEDELVDALANLTETDVNRAVVLEDGRLVGFLSVTDLVRALEVGGLRRRRAPATTGAAPRA